MDLNEMEQELQRPAEDAQAELDKRIERHCNIYGFTYLKEAHKKSIKELLDFARMHR